LQRVIYQAYPSLRNTDDGATRKKNKKCKTPTRKAKEIKTLTKTE
jgi:hypothetical protein